MTLDTIIVDESYFFFFAGLKKKKRNEFDSLRSLIGHTNPHTQFPEACDLETNFFG